MERDVLQHELRRHFASRRRSVSLVMAVVLCWLLPTAEALAQSEDRAAAGSPKAKSERLSEIPRFEPLDAKTEPDIQRWINALGDADFYLRERAAREIEQLGPAAFDELAVAEEHADPEVAARARALLTRIPIAFIGADDPALTREYLEGYAEGSEPERSEVITRLAELPQNLGVGALARIARFDSSPLLAREAALRLVRDVIVNTEDLNEQVEAISAELGESQRTPVAWLRRHLQFCPAALEAPNVDNAELAEHGRAWIEQARAERARLSSSSGSSNSNVTNTQIVLGLYEHAGEQFAQAARLGLDDAERQLSELAAEMISAADDSVPTLLQLMRWIQLHQQPEALTIFHARFQEPIKSHPLLASVYALRVENMMGAEEAKPVWDKAADVRKFTPAELGYYPQEADLPPIYLAYRIQKEGGLEAARKEYHAIIKRAPASEYEGLQARMLLAESLADQERFGEAASFMQEAASAMRDNERRGRRAWGIGGPDPAEVQSRSEYFAALAEKDTNEEKYIELMRKSIDSDMSNPDGLIELYNKPGNTAQQMAGLRGLIVNALTIHQQRFVADPTDDTSLNLWAWLASKTFGDSDLAVDYSLRALRIEPGSASYFDTLAVCFAAKNDFVNAVRCQTRAVQADPFADKLRTRLADYREALQAQAGSTKPGGAPGP